MLEEDIKKLMQNHLDSYGLKEQGWTYVIVDEMNGWYGYTDFDKKLITLTREYWPTSSRNIRELIFHEIAHALCGHGEHDLQWWDKLLDIGGRGVWVDRNTKPKRISVQVTY